MVNIQRASNQAASFILSGRVESEDVEELQRILNLEPAGETITLDLQDVTLIARDGVKLLSRCEAENVKLMNCPAYIREWIVAERSRNSRHEAVNGSRMW